MINVKVWRRVAGAAGVLAAVAGLTAVAPDGPTGLPGGAPAAAGTGSLSLSVYSQPQGAGGAGGKAGRAAPAKPVARTTLTCPALPGSGRNVAPGLHPHASQACRALAKVDGHLDKLTGDAHAMCPMLYAPVRAEAHGIWHGRRVDFRTMESNRCRLTAKLKPVYDF